MALHIFVFVFSLSSVNCNDFLEKVVKCISGAFSLFSFFLFLFRVVSQLEWLPRKSRERSLFIYVIHSWKVNNLIRSFPKKITAKWIQLTENLNVSLNPLFHYSLVLTCPNIEFPSFYKRSERVCYFLYEIFSIFQISLTLVNDIR